MNWLSKLFSRWPKRLPEGYVKCITVKHLMVFVCGENHPELEKAGRLGGTMAHNDVVWLRGYRRKDGSITVTPDDKILAHEIRRVLHNNDAEMVNANMYEER